MTDAVASTDPSGPLRVLCVEDDRVAALLFSEALRHIDGIELRLAERPSEALAIVAHWQPDVLVLDAHLPEMSGHALLARLRAEPALARVPAAMQSADHDGAARAAAAAAGFDAYWVKPVMTDRLPRQLRALAAVAAGAAEHPVARAVERSADRSPA